MSKATHIEVSNHQANCMHQRKASLPHSSREHRFTLQFHSRDIICYRTIAVEITIEDVGRLSEFWVVEFWVPGFGF